MKDIIKLHDRKFKIMIPAEKIDEAVSAVAQRINEDYGDKETPLFVGVLNGSFMFMSDLIKKIEFNNELSFVKLASGVTSFSSTPSLSTIIAFTLDAMSDMVVKCFNVSAGKFTQNFCYPCNNAYKF